MKTIKHTSYTSVMEAVNGLKNCECIGVVEDTLLDHLMYAGENENGVEIVMLAISCYVNANSSDYTVKIAVTDQDKEKLYGLFYDIEQAAAYYA